MASYQQLCYCKNCKKNVSLDSAGKCKTCGSSQIKKSWTVRFRIIDFKGEKHKRLTGFETKKQAESAYIQFINSYTPPKAPNKSYKFEDILKNYFIYCTTENTESTIYDKKSIFNLYIVPYFENKNINDITKEDLINWQNTLWNYISPKTKQKFSWKYLTKIRGSLYNFLQYCENIYDITNQMRTIKIPKNKTSKKEINFWELKDFDQFIETVDDIRWKTLWYTFMFTGARFNEVRALSDEDINDNRIIINKAIAKSIGESLKITPTKNTKIVEKQIPTRLKEQIIKYKQWKNENNISSKFLFGGDMPLSSNKIRRQLVLDIKKSKLPYISPHGFRHSYVSMLIHLGVSTKIIAELIGDREEQVIRTYGHLYSNAKNDAIELLNRHLSNKI